MSRRILEGKGVAKSFGGLMALRQIDFYLEEGEIVGLIGPNGAGKTTLFNVVSGVYPPDRGELFFNGRSISSLKPYQICRLGIGRTFQIVRPFLKMTCLENILISLIGRGEKGKNLGEKKKEAREYLEFVGLKNRESRLAKDLTLIEKKRLEVARALASKPKLLLLDEVLAGLNPSEILQALQLIRVIQTQMKITIFWIEHVMGAIMKASDRIIVLDQGEKIKEGKPEEIVSDPRVIEAYLGESNA